MVNKSLTVLILTTKKKQFNQILKRDCLQLNNTDFLKANNGIA